VIASATGPAHASCTAPEPTATPTAALSAVAVQSSVVTADDEIAPQTAHVAGRAVSGTGSRSTARRRYQPRVSSSCSGARLAVEMPTIGSPRPVETRASTSASR
jgi:hypothetical protein